MSLIMLLRLYFYFSAFYHIESRNIQKNQKSEWFAVCSNVISMRVHANWLCGRSGWWVVIHLQQIQIICKFKELPAAQVTCTHFSTSFGQDLRLFVFCIYFTFSKGYAVVILVRWLFHWKCNCCPLKGVHWVGGNWLYVLISIELNVKLSWLNW